MLDNLMRRPEAGAVLGMVFVLVFFTIFGGVNFLSLGGVASWLNVAASIGIIAIPIGFLMIAGELDISVGAMVPASSMCIGVVSGYFELPIAVGILITMALSLAVGLLNGWLVLKTNVPSLIVTMGTLFGVLGLTLWGSLILTGNTAVALESPPWAKAMFGDFVFGDQFQVTVLWWVGFAVLCFYFLHLSPWGNWVFALGGDRVSARNAGIPTSKLTMGLFVLSSMSAGFVGMSQTMLYNAAQVSSGMSFIFNTIISSVIGGVLLTGGFGSVLGIFLGTITFAIVNQGIYFTDFDRNLSSLIIGAMLLAAVVLNNTFREAALKAKPKQGAQKS